MQKRDWLPNPEPILGAGWFLSVVTFIGGWLILVTAWSKPR